jgi:multidrug resistance efflux pump
VGWAVVFLALGLLAVPVRLSAVAPAEVAPRDPVVVAAPIPGVVAEVAVSPNAEVAAGDVLVRFETAELDARLAVAERSLAVAEADLLRARQEAFGDPRSSAEVALKQAAVELRRAERDFAAWLVGESTIRAERAGLAVFASASEWTGRPVAVGERIMAIADPAAVRVDIRVPVADAVALQPGAPVSLILDVDPLNPVRAAVERAAFQPEEGPGGVLAYRVTATIAADQPVPRIGLTGTARIAGETVPLGLFLFRRPLAAARQWLGL